ncbi:alpha/beta fold hydrolase [Cytophagaceae bacterium ABcell3]|nr:alpha/beta fold hydrolase [Cytophagaceae bacterium ABcell3]
MKLFYRELGQGEPLIILHGVFGSSDNWLTPAKLLEDDYKVYLLDARNHGQSPHSDEFTYDAMADDLMEMIQELGLENPLVMGHSMGGKVVMKFAIKYPDAFKKLVVVDIAPKYYPVHHNQILEGLNAIKPENISGRNEADKILSEYVPELPVRQFLLKNLYRNDENKYAWRINLPVVTEKIEQIGEALPEDASVEKPVLFIRGANSRYIKDEDKPLIESIFKKASLETIEGAGHWVHAEKPSAFIKVVKDFF